MRVERRGLGWKSLVALALFVLATRAPFLGAGYGVDADAWRLADASRRIAITGEYVLSRPPGYPVVEYGGALFWRGGPFALNGLSAIACALACVAIALLAQRLRPRTGLPAALAFAFTPVVYIASTSAMDYLWALAPALGALLAARSARPLAAGLALGLAIGARLPIGVLLAPCALLLWRGPRGLRGAMAASCTALAVGALAYVPVLSAHGLAGQAPSRGGPPSIGRILELLGVLAHGWIGTAAIVLALLAVAVPRAEKRARPPSERGLEAALLLGLALTGAVFLWMPYEPGYVIPLTALALPLITARLPVRASWALAGALALSSFLEFQGAAPAPGPILRDHGERIVEGQRMNRIRSAARAIVPAPVVIVGSWYPKLSYLLGSGREDGVLYLTVLQEEVAASCRASGRSMLYLDGVANWHTTITGLSLEELGAVPLFGEER